jgi:predicted aspartyl protease
MVRYRYNAQVEPPAPFIHATVSHPEREEAIADLPAQLDTAADMTVVPEEVIKRLGLVPIEEVPVGGFGGQVTEFPAYFVEITLRDMRTVSVKVLGSRDEPYILLGRDVLNEFRIVLDGPQCLLEIG